MFSSIESGCFIINPLLISPSGKDKSLNKLALNFCTNDVTSKSVSNIFVRVNVCSALKPSASLPEYQDPPPGFIPITVLWAEGIPVFWLIEPVVPSM